MRPKCNLGEVKIESMFLSSCSSKQFHRGLRAFFSSSPWLSSASNADFMLNLLWWFLCYGFCKPLWRIFWQTIPPVLYLNTSGGDISFFLVSFLRVSTGYGNSVSHSSGYCMCQTQLINLYNIFQWRLLTASFRWLLASSSSLSPSIILS